MKISTKGRYALRIMLDLAQNSKGEYIPLKDISSRQGITIKYMEQIVPMLTKAGLVRSLRGNNGGYMLSKAPEEYTIGEILRCAEGSLAPIACLEDEMNQCPRSKNCGTLAFWEGMRDVVYGYADSKTLKDLL